MDERRWQQIQEIFSRAVDLPLEEQRAAVAEFSACDESLAADVLAMLAEDAKANPLLDSSLDETARAILDFGPLPSLIQREIGPYRLLRLLGEHGQHFGREGFVSGAELCNSGALLFQRQVDGTGKKFLDLLPSALVHAGLLLASYARAVPKDCPLK